MREKIRRKIKDTRKIRRDRKRQKETETYLLLKSTITPIQSKNMTTPMDITTMSIGRRPSKQPSHLK